MICDLFVGINEADIERSLDKCCDSGRVFEFFGLWVAYENVLRCDLRASSCFAVGDSTVVRLAADVKGFPVIGVGKEAFEFFVVLAENFFCLIGCER